MNIVKIFLASSLGEEKNKFRQFLSNENDFYKDTNIYFEITMMNDDIDFTSKPEFRDEYIKAITNCEIFVSIFSTKARRFMLDEVETAIKNFKAGGNPQYVFTYFREAPSTINQNTSSLDELFDFKNKLKGMGHFYKTYVNASDIMNDFRSQLEKVLISKNPSVKKERKEIFISYSHKNEDWMGQLLTYLKPLEKKGLIKVWSDKKIEIGDKWSESIEQSMLEAKIGLLLITQEYLASDFISEKELPKLIKYSEEGCIILPVILEPCTVQFEIELKQFQFFNPPNSPFSGLNDNDRKNEFVRLTDAIFRLYEKQ